MKFAMIATDLAALGVILGAATQYIPAIAGLLAVVYYGFVIYDRIRYGPELEQRTFWHRRQNKGEIE